MDEFIREPTEYPQSGVFPDAVHQDGLAWSNGNKWLKPPGRYHYTQLLKQVLQQKNAEIRDLRDSLELRIREESDTRAAQERVMIHQARRAAMGELLGTIAHKWRQPLNSLSMIVQNMRDAWEYEEIDESFMDHHIARAMEQINLMSRTIVDFSNFMRPNSSMERFCPKRCVLEVVALLGGWFSGFNTFPTEVVDELAEEVEVRGGENEFKQVMLSLLCYAKDAILSQPRENRMHNPGRITVRIGREGAFVLIGVENDGGGIGASPLENIFKPYLTTREKADGMNIGLYMSKLIVENMMNGTIRTENRPGGTLFVVSLPALPPDTGGPDERSDTGCFTPLCRG
jgi:signal transduction histidine kinase